MKKVMPYISVGICTILFIAFIGSEKIYSQENDNKPKESIEKERAEDAKNDDTPGDRALLNKKEPSPFDQEAAKEKIQKSINKYLSLMIGFKGYYTLGVSPENFTYEPYSEAHVKHKYFDIKVGYSRFINFQITNGFNSYMEINFHEPYINIEVHPTKKLNIFGGYKFSSWYDNYTSHYYEGGLLFDFHTVTVETGCSYTRTVYDFLSFTSMIYRLSVNQLEIRKVNPYVDINIYLADWVGLNAAFNFKDERYGYYNDIYRRYMGRIGGFLDLFDFVIFSAELRLGMDSIDFLIVAPDFGFILKPFKNLQMEFNYGFEYNKGKSLTASEKAQRLRMVIQPWYVYWVILTNPKLRLATIGRSFAIYNLSFGISTRY